MCHRGVDKNGEALHFLGRVKDFKTYKSDCKV